MNDEVFLDDPRLLDGLERLVAIERLGASLAGLPWFAHLGEPLLEDEVTAARLYLDALGATGAVVAPVGNWAEAAVCAENPGFDSVWWDIEEQMRAGLTVEALDLIDQDELTLALSRIGQHAVKVAGDAATVAAGLAKVEDEELVRAATGSAVQAVHHHALAIAAAVPSEHAFFARFSLFKSGRWPIAVVGESLQLF